MSWTIQNKPVGGRKDWRIPSKKTDRDGNPVPTGGEPAGILAQHAEETVAVEDLNILVEDLGFLPRFIQDGEAQWQQEQINLASEWSPTDLIDMPAGISGSSIGFYPRRLKWLDEAFYPQLFRWEDDAFYPQKFRWGLEFFYPKNFLVVWQGSSISSRSFSPDFYPQRFRWLLEDFYPKNFLDVWQDSEPFYPQQFKWSEQVFYPSSDSWYLSCL